MHRCHAPQGDPTTHLCKRKTSRVSRAPSAVITFTFVSLALASPWAGTASQPLTFIDGPWAGLAIPNLAHFYRQGPVSPTPHIYWPDPSLLSSWRNLRATGTAKWYHYYSIFLGLGPTLFGKSSVGEPRRINYRCYPVMEPAERRDCLGQYP